MNISRILTSAAACAVVGGLAACSPGSESEHDHSTHEPGPAADDATDPADSHAGHDHGSHATDTAVELTKTEPSTDYPLTTCVVSGEPLDAMGTPMAFEYDGQEVQFCCEGCVDEFKESPAKFIAEIKAAGQR